MDKIEHYIRLRFNNFPTFLFMAEINNVSIDFIREASKYVDIKKILWEARPWNVDQTIEEHMEMWHKHLKEFWKDILRDKKYEK